MHKTTKVMNLFQPKKAKKVTKHKSTQEIKEELKAIEGEFTKYVQSESDDSTNSPSSSSADLLEGQPAPPLSHITEKWQEFVVKTGQTLQQLQDDMHQNHIQHLANIQERKKQAHVQRMKRLERREARVKARFDKRLADFNSNQEAFNAQLIEMKNALYDKKKENRDKFHDHFQQAQEKWDQVSYRRQRNTERFLKAFNRWGWRQQLRCILILLPLLAVVILVFLLLRPFLTFL